MGRGTEESVEAARELARERAGRAAVVIAEVHDHARAEAASQLFDRVWGRGTGAGAIMTREALTALAHAGGQVSVAEREGEVLGATAAYLGRDHATGQLFLHSHVTGVDPGSAGTGIGGALKWHQRAWCLANGLGQVRWTFDPLVRRNAVFNLLHLGAQVVRYEHDLYGAMEDVRNAGLPTDRLVAVWDLTGPRTRAAAGGRDAAPDLEGLRHAGAETWVEEGADGRPRVTPTRAARRLVRVPADIEALRTEDRDAAAAWASALRDTLGTALRAGERVTGITRDGWFVLARPAGVAELTDVR
jgi:predicted GNAT superfamily acetyltransferase